MMISMGTLTAATTAGCNAITNNYSLALIPPHTFNSTSIRLRKNNLLRNLSNARLVPVAATTVNHPNGVAVDSEEERRNLKEQLRLGSLTEDGLSYKERFFIRWYEVGVNKTATIETMANLLQESVGNHIHCAGFITHRLAKHHIMVAARMHIEIYRYPAWRDVVEIETWCQGEGRIAIRRDWIIRDYANGEVIGRATSKWVTMNLETRKLQKFSDDVIDEYSVFCPKTLRLAFHEENNNSLKKIGKLEDPAEYSKLGLAPRRTDLDMNGHVNNVTYIGWVLESIPQEVIDTHELQSITLDFKRECLRDEVVDSLTTPEPLDAAAVSNNGYVDSKTDGMQLNKFLHLMRSSGNGHEINRCRTEWRKSL
ncbi:oleoyl-acyl carrier protein thioesterase, chloroplastic-like [Rutidosis leptorrhynchoides]|uniref:oleoyl-acyl carrier protein thioesterase, chloroplastic-like n=1 Tax=Rutidosis leptorrhynchoides TaxID=125765 RepID=UPI003A99604A